METEIKFTYEERQAIAVLRKSIKRKPELANEIMKGMAREVAVNILLQVQKELSAMMIVSQAFSAAAKAVMPLDKKEPDHAGN